MCYHMHAISCYDLYCCCQICVFPKIHGGSNKEGYMCVVRLKIIIVVGIVDEGDLRGQMKK